MKEYMKAKLQNLATTIERCKNNIIKSATELNIKAIIPLTETLMVFQESAREFSKDAARYLTVSEFIELYELGLIDRYSAEYVFKYDKHITLAERNSLEKLHYGFKEARVK